MKKNLSLLFAVLIGLGAVFFLRRDSGPKMVWIYGVRRKEYICCEGGACFKVCRV